MKSRGVWTKNRGVWTKSRGVWTKTLVLGRSARRTRTTDSVQLRKDLLYRGAVCGWGPRGAEELVLGVGVGGRAGGDLRGWGTCGGDLSGWGTWGGDVGGTWGDVGGRVFFVCEHPKGCVFLRETERAPRETVDKDEGGGGQRLRGCGQRWGGVWTNGGQRLDFGGQKKIYHRRRTPVQVRTRSRGRLKPPVLRWRTPPGRRHAPVQVQARGRLESPVLRWRTLSRRAPVQVQARGRLEPPIL